MRQLLLLLLLLLPLLFLLTADARITCTVGNYFGANFTSLTTAIIECGGGGTLDPDIEIVLTNQTYNNPVILVPEAVLNLTIRVDPFNVPCKPDLPHICPGIPNDCNDILNDFAVLNATVYALGNGTAQLALTCDQYFPVPINCSVLNATLLGCNQSCPDLLNDPGALNETIFALGNGTAQLAFNCSSYFPPVNCTAVTNATLAGCIPTNCTSDVQTMAHIKVQLIFVSWPFTQLWFTGLWFDMGASNTTLFVSFGGGPLVDNNVTIESCLFYNNHANRTIDMESCGAGTAPNSEVIFFKSHCSRYKDCWGSAIAVQGVWNYDIDNNTFDRCGGFNNHSCVLAKHNWITEGNSIFRNNDQWLLVNREPPKCQFACDPDGMVQCLNGVPYCYSITLTQNQGTCPLVNTSFFNITANETQFIMDYDKQCRVYSPCGCATVQFMIVNTTISNFYLAGDLYFYTGLTLPCVALSNGTFDSMTNMTFIRSFAGDPSEPNGIFGVPPPFNTTGWYMNLLPTSGSFIYMLPCNDSNNFTRLDELFVPANSTIFVQNNSYIPPGGNVSLPIIREIAANSSLMTLQGSCWCNTTVANVSLSDLLGGCQYDIPNLNSTVFDEMPGVVPNNSIPGESFHCNNGTFECCSDVMCNTLIPCTCPFQPNYTDPAQFNQTTPYNTSQILDFVTIVNTTNNIWQVGPPIDVPGSVTMIAALLGLVLPNDTAPFGSVVTTAETVIGSAYLCIFVGNCPIPILQMFDPRINLTCVNNTLECPCDDLTLIKVLVPYFASIGNQSSAYHIDNIPDSIGSYIITGNSAQQLPIGIRMDRITQFVIVNNSLLAPYWSDERTVLRETWRQNNQFITGTHHDYAYGQAGRLFYEVFCDGGCVQPFQTVSAFLAINNTESVCIVDSTSGPPLPPNYFTAIQDAFDAGCVDTIVVASNFYVEDLIIHPSVKRLYTFDSATIVGVHLLQGINVEIRGINFFHPGDKSTPLFSTTGAFNNFTALNCLFDGNGVRGAGIFGQVVQPINIIAINYSLIRNWNFLGIQVWQMQEFDMHYNTFNRVWGRAIDIEYSIRISLSHNHLTDVRGARQLSGIPTIALRQRLGAEQTGCANQTLLPCVFVDNIQDTDPTGPDYQDIIYYFQRGNWIPAFISGNCVIKGHRGMRFDQVQSVTRNTIGTIVVQNALVRPSNFPVSALSNRIALNTAGVGISNTALSQATSNIYDFELDAYFANPFFGFVFSPTSNVLCNFPCIAVLGIQAAVNVCQANNNFDNGYVDDYGYQTFHNISQAELFCRAANITNNALALTIPVEGTAWGGARLMPDHILFRFPTSVYSIALPFEFAIGGSWRGDPPPVCSPRLVIYGIGHSFWASPLSLTYLEFRMWNQNIIGVPLLTTNSTDFPVFNGTFDRVTWDGRAETTVTSMPAVYILSGIDYNTTEQYNSNVGGFTTVIPTTTPTQSYVFNLNIFRNFFSYDPFRMVDEQNVTVPSVGFPYFDALYVQFLDVSIGVIPTYNEINITSCRFQRIDRRASELRDWDRCLYFNNSHEDCGGRAQDSLTTVLLKGNSYATGQFAAERCNFSFNQAWQNQPVLFPHTSQIRSAHGSQYWLLNFAIDAKLCINNNSASDMEVGLRLSNGNYSIILPNCFDNITNPVQYPDDPADILRRLFAAGNQNLTGTVYWLYICEPFRDFDMHCVFCNNGCVPIPPTECAVSLTNFTITNPNHPLHGIYYFTSINTAIVNCTLAFQPNTTDYIIRVDPNTPYTNYFEVINPQFPLGHPVLNLSLSRIVKPRVICEGPLGAPLNTTFSGQKVIAFSGPNATIEACDNVLQLGRLRMERCVFLHPSNCTPGVSTWQQLTIDPLPDPLQLEFFADSFNGSGTTSPALTGIFDDGFLLQSSYFLNYTGSFVTSIAGRNCSVFVIVQNNEWDNAPGNALTVLNVGGYLVGLNNFSQCGCQLHVPLEAAVSLSLCPVTALTPPNNLTFRSNTFRSPTTGTLPQPTDGGTEYCRCYYLDQVPDASAGWFIDIRDNVAFCIAAGLVFDDMPNPCPRTDQQEHLRHYALYETNIQVHGKWHDLLWVKAPGDPPFLLPTIDSNPNAFLCHWCDNGCPIANELILMIIIAVILGIIVLLIICCLICTSQPVGPRFYYSSVVEMPIPVDAMSYWSIYGFDPATVLYQKEIADRAAAVAQ